MVALSRYWTICRMNPLRGSSGYERRSSVLAKAFLQQNPELQNFLSEFGFRLLSDWALFNRVGVQQLSLLTDRDRNLVEAFQAVYRRDRIQQKDRTGKCPDPSQAQLREMLSLLIYCEGKSQGETAALLGITNQPKVSRLLNLTGLLNQS